MASAAWELKSARALESKETMESELFEATVRGSRSHTSDPANHNPIGETQYELLHAQARETKMHRSPAVVQSLVAHASAPRECGQAANQMRCGFPKSKCLVFHVHYENRLAENKFKHHEKYARTECFIFHAH